MPEWMDKVENAIREKYSLFYVTEVWGHVIYRRAEKARWKIPQGMKTLAEFLKWHEKQEIEQKRSDHPLVLEIYCIITTKKPLTRRETEFIIEILKKDLYNEFFESRLYEEYMEWGETSRKSSEIVPLEARKRWSRDGEYFEADKDITDFVSGRIEFKYEG